MKESNFKNTEIGLVPNDWVVKKVEEIFWMIPNNTLSRDKLNYYNGEFKDIHYGDILVEFGEWIDCSNVGLPFINSNAKFNHTVLQDGDIVIADTAEDETVGKSTEITNAKNKKIVSGLHTIPIRPKIKFAPKWLGYYINSACWHDQILPFITGTKVSAISKAAVSQTKLFFPAKIEEQQRIANALSDVDALIANLEKLIAKKKNIKQGAMQSLLSGKKRLPGFGSDERTGSRPTDERRKECRSERSAKREVEESSGYKMTELGLIPSDWEVKKIGDFCKVYDGTHQTPHYVDVGIPFYSVENVSADDFEHTKFISNSEYEFISKRASIEKGDVLMTRIGSIGVCKYVDWDCKSGFYVSLSLLKCNEKIDARYLCQQSKSEAFKKEIELHSLTTAIPQKINLGPISQVRIIVPTSKAEQTAIANVLSDMDAEIDALEQKLAKMRKIKQGMMQELLTGKIRLV